MSRSDPRLDGARVVASTLCVAILWASPNPLVDLAAAAPLVFYLPGAAVMSALEAEPEGRLETVSLRATLSLAIVVIVGLLLHLADSITRQGWLASLGAIVCAASLVSLVRRGRVAAARSPGPARPWAALRPADLTIVTLALGLTGAAVAVAVVINLGRHDFAYTQLWIVPKQGDPESVVVGVRNAEAGEQTYAIELMVDRGLVQSWSDISLKPGETWTTTFRWVGFGKYPRPVEPVNEAAHDPGAPRETVSERVGLGAAPRVEALLYRSEDRSAVYRRVWTAPQCAAGEDAHGRPPCVF